MTKKKLSLRLQDWREVVEVDWPEQAVTNGTVRETQKASYRFGGGARFAMGKIITDKEYEARRARAYRPLP